MRHPTAADTRRLSLPHRPLAAHRNTLGWRCTVIRCENGSWFNHVLEWWEAAKADPEHILFLHYEQMLADPEGHIRKIADFAGIEHTREIIAKVSLAHSHTIMFERACAGALYWSRVRYISFGFGVEKQAKFIP